MSGELDDRRRRARLGVAARRIRDKARGLPQNGQRHLRAEVHRGRSAVEDGVEEPRAVAEDGRYARALHGAAEQLGEGRPALVLGGGVGGEAADAALRATAAEQLDG